VVGALVGLIVGLVLSAIVVQSDAAPTHTTTKGVQLDCRTVGPAARRCDLYLAKRINRVKVVLHHDGEWAADVNVSGLNPDAAHHSGTHMVDSPLRERR
jgi:hypothetical protein